MGRAIRSILVVFGVVAIWMCQSGLIEALALRPGARAATIVFCFAMEMLSLGFVMLLQRPFFSRPKAGDDQSPSPSINRPLRALAVLFGLLQIYPGISALLIGLGDRGEKDSAIMFVVGAFLLATALGFIFGGMRGLLAWLASPESFVEE